MKRINRIVALVITLMLTSFALGETFEVRDGIHYGMTEDSKKTKMLYVPA